MCGSALMFTHKGAVPPPDGELLGAFLEGGTSGAIGPPFTTSLGQSTACMKLVTLLNHEIVSHCTIVACAVPSFTRPKEKTSL